MAEDKDKTVANLAPSAPAAMKSRARWWLRIESLFLVVGLLLLGLYGAARLDRLLSSRQLLDEFAAANSGAIRAEELNATNQSSITPLASRAVHAKNGKVREAVTTTEALGALSIPKIHLEAPILDGTDALTLNHAIGRIEGTAPPGEKLGNIGLAGHRDGFFRDLGKLKAGDLIELETTSGTDKYVVEGIRIVKPEDVWVLAPRSVPSLTLVTCYPFHGIGHAPERYVITASLAEKPERPASIADRPRRTMTNMATP